MRVKKRDQKVMLVMVYQQWDDCRLGRPGLNSDAGILFSDTTDNRPHMLCSAANDRSCDYTLFSCNMHIHIMSKRMAPHMDGLLRFKPHQAAAGPDRRAPSLDP